MDWDRTFTATSQKDYDGDGLIAASHSGLDPDDSRWDSDGDSLSDAYELQIGTDPRVQDTDADGLSDGQEVQMGTDPLRPDTDGDGLTDAEEVFHQHYQSGAWVGGWAFTYAPGQTTHVSSNPNDANESGDGLNDRTKKVLHLRDAAAFPYHPHAFGTSPLAVSLTTSDADRVVLPNTTLVLTTTLSSNLRLDAEVKGTLTTTFSSQLGGSLSARRFQLFRYGETEQVTSVTATGPSNRATVAYSVNGKICEPDCVPGAANRPSYLDIGGLAIAGNTITIDDDAPTSSLRVGIFASGNNTYIQAAQSATGKEVRTIGGLAQDPISFVDYVEVSEGGGPWQRATGRSAWAYNWTLPNGQGRVTLRTRATDVVGHQESPVNEVTVIPDGAAPIVSTTIGDNPLLRPRTGTTTRWAIPITGTVADGNVGADLGSGVGRVEVSIDPHNNGWQPATLSLNGTGGTWIINYDLAASAIDPSGQYTVSVRAIDNVGNDTDAGSYGISQFRVDGAPPSVTLDDPPSPPRGSSGSPLSGVVTLNGDCDRSGHYRIGCARRGDCLHARRDVGFTR